MTEIPQHMIKLSIRAQHADLDPFRPHCRSSPDGWLSSRFRLPYLRRSSGGTTLRLRQPLRSPAALWSFPPASLWSPRTVSAPGGREAAQGGQEPELRPARALRPLRSTSRVRPSASLSGAVWRRPVRVARTLGVSAGDRPQCGGLLSGRRSRRKWNHR